MANLDARVRGGTTIWPWVIGLAVLAAAIWGVTQLIDPGTPAPGPTGVTDVEQVVEPPMATPTPAAGAPRTDS